MLLVKRPAPDPGGPLALLGRRGGLVDVHTSMRVPVALGER